MEFGSGFAEDIVNNDWINSINSEFKRTRHTVPGKSKLTISTQNSILDVFANRESSFEARVSSFEFRDTRRVF